MSKIDVYSAEVTELAARLNKIASELSDAAEITGKVQKNLNFQVAAKQGISSGLRKTKTNLQKQKSKVRSLSDLAVVSDAEFRYADGQIDKKTLMLLRKMHNPAIGIVRDIKDFFAGISIKEYAMIASLFAPAGSIVSVVGLRELCGRLAVITTGGKTGSTGSGTGAGPVQTTSPVTEPVQTTPPAPKSYENMVSFSSATYEGKTNGEYADYSILEEMKPEYCYAQPSGSDKCLACADACVGSIKGKGELTPNTSWTGTCQYTTRVGIHTNNDSGDWTPEQIRTRAYQELLSGRPTVVRVQSPNSNDMHGGHSVVVVGLRNGADPNNLTDADFLIMDPSGGKIKALSELKQVAGTGTCIKPNELDKDDKVVKGGIRMVDDKKFK